MLTGQVFTRCPLCGQLSLDPRTGNCDSQYDDITVHPPVDPEATR